MQKGMQQLMQARALGARFSSRPCARGFLSIRHARRRRAGRRQFAKLFDVPVGLPWMKKSFF